MNYEYLTLKFLNQSGPETWAIMEKFLAGKKKQKRALKELISNSSSAKLELWFLDIFMQNPHCISRLQSYAKGDNNVFSEKCSISAVPLLRSYFAGQNVSELHLDNVIAFKRYREMMDEDEDKEPVCDKIPSELFRFCPNAEIVSLRNNQLTRLPADIGRLKVEFYFL